MVLNLGEIAYVIIVPLLFLYFQNLLYETKWNRKMLLHFVVPIIILILNYARFFFIDEQIVRQLKMAIFVVYIPFTLMYVFLTLRIFNIQMKERKSDIDAIKKQNMVIVKWSIVLITFFVVMALKAVVYMNVLLITNAD